MSRSDMPAGLLHAAIADKNAADVREVLRDYVADLRPELIRKPKEQELTYIKQALDSGNLDIANSVYTATLRALRFLKYEEIEFESIGPERFSFLDYFIRSQGDENLTKKDEDYLSKFARAISIPFNTSVHRRYVALALKMSHSNRVGFLLSSIIKYQRESDFPLFLFNSLLTKTEDEKKRLIFEKIPQEIDRYCIKIGKEIFSPFRPSHYDDALYRGLDSIASQYEIRPLLKKLLDAVIEKQIGKLTCTKFSPSIYVSRPSIKVPEETAKHPSISVKTKEYFEQIVFEHAKAVEGKYITFWQEKEPELLTAINDANVQKFREILKSRDPREQGKVIFALWILKFLLNDSIAIDSIAIDFLTPYCFFQNNVYLKEHKIDINLGYGKKEIENLLGESTLRIRDELISCYDDQYYYKLYSYIQVLKIEIANLPVGSADYKEKQTKKAFCSKILDVYNSLKKSQSISKLTIPTLVGVILNELNKKIAVNIDFNGPQFEISKSEAELLLKGSFFPGSNMPLDLFRELARADSWYGSWSERWTYKVIEKSKLAQGPGIFEQTAGGSEQVEMCSL